MFTIRPADLKDCEGICGLITSAEELFLVYPSGKFPFTVEQVQELFKVRQDLTVAVCEERIVAFANLYGHEAGKHAFIGNVVVDAAFRGRGLGREMVSHILGKAFEKYALPEVRISVFNDNTPALLLYASMGFSPYDVEVREKPNGEKTALIHMAKKRDY